MLTTALALVFVLAFFRAEHLFASDWWIYFRGPEVADRLEELAVAERESDHQALWNLFVSSGAGKLPWLALGLKSYRLERLAARSSQPQKTIVRLIRLPWRFFVFGPLLSAGLLVLGWFPHGFGTVDLVLAYLIGLALLSCFVALSLESVLASDVFTSWADVYHRFPHPHLGKSRRRSRERGMSLFVLFLCAFASGSFTSFVALRSEGGALAVVTGVLGGAVAAAVTATTVVA